MTRTTYHGFSVHSLVYIGNTIYYQLAEQAFNGLPRVRQLVDKHTAVILTIRKLKQFGLCIGPISLH